MSRLLKQSGHNMMDVFPSSSSYRLLSSRLLAHKAETESLHFLSQCPDFNVHKYTSSHSHGSASISMSPAAQKFPFADILVPMCTQPTLDSSAHMCRGPDTYVSSQFHLWPRCYPSLTSHRYLASTLQCSNHKTKKNKRPSGAKSSTCCYGSRFIPLEVRHQLEINEILLSKL